MVFHRWKTSKITGVCGKHALVVAPRGSGAGAERPQEPRTPGAWEIGVPGPAIASQWATSRRADLVVDESEWCRWDARR